MKYCGKQLLVLLVVTCLALSGCNTIPVTITTTETVITTQSITTNTTAEPKVYELKMFGIEGEANMLLIPTSPGDQVVCEINAYRNWAFCFIFIEDAFGNTIAESAKTTIVHVEEGQSYPWGKQDPPYLVTTIMSNQKYPWKYSFYATTSLYVLGVSGAGYLGGETSVYIKVIVYPVVVK